MPEDTFTPEQIQEIVNQACEISDFEKRELHIKQACNENESCIEKVKSKLSLSNEEPQIHSQTTDDLAEKLSSDIHSIKNKEREDKEISLLGKKIGVYKLTKKLGKSGMALVYRSAKQDEGDYEDFAVKVIIDKTFTNDYFFEESEKLKKVDQHPNIARLFESGIDEETDYPYFILQYINGKPITNYCEDKTLSLTNNTFAKKMFENVS